MLSAALFLGLASISYVIGGIAMKYSDGYRAIWPSVFVFVFFCLGAGLQNWEMQRAELGKGYVIVLGLEAVFAVAAGVVFFGESLSLYKVLGTLMVLLGMIFLKV